MASDPRRVAFEVLRAVAEQDAYANLELARRTRGLSGRDAGFVTELAAGTLRMQGAYDAIIDSLVSRALDPAVRDALRLGAHQLLSMRVPTHAAVGTTVALVKKAIGHKPSGLVNAVLRKVSVRDMGEWMDELGASLATRTSHPEWVVEALREALGDDPTPLLEADNVPAKVTLVARPGLADVDELPGRSLQISPYAVEHSGGDPSTIPAVRERRAGVQDAGSQLMAIALSLPPLTRAGPLVDDSELAPGRGVQGAPATDVPVVEVGVASSADVPVVEVGVAPATDVPVVEVGVAPATDVPVVEVRGAPATDVPVVEVRGAPATSRETEAPELQSSEVWLDMCAGPGGKAALLQALADQRGAVLIAAERQPHRAELVRKAGVREVVAADGTRAPWDRVFDRVLVDVPCSGLGALRRRPEARWRKWPTDIEQLAPLQRGLLHSALDSTRPGGIVAYATCSPVLAETAEVVRAVLAERSDATLEDAPSVLDWVPNCGSTTLPGAVQLWPHVHGTDAMFLALLRVASPATD